MTAVRLFDLECIRVVHIFFPVPIPNNANLGVRVEDDDRDYETIDDKELARRQRARQLENAPQAEHMFPPSVTIVVFLKSLGKHPQERRGLGQCRLPLVAAQERPQRVPQLLLLQFFHRKAHLQDQRARFPRLNGCLYCQ